jgi:phosphatidylglycerophosphate synthase
MLVAKQVADFLTLLRASLTLFLAWLGLIVGADGLLVAAVILMVSWTSDALDGPIARRSRVQYHTWLGDHDLLVDIVFSVGLLLYMVEAGFVEWVIGVIYALGWLFVFCYWGILRSPGMLFQAPIFGWFIWITILHATPFGMALLVWIVLAVIITWPRFPRQVIPEFLGGMGAFLKKL